MRDGSERPGMRSGWMMLDDCTPRLVRVPARGNGGWSAVGEDLSVGLRMWGGGETGERDG